MMRYFAVPVAVLALLLGLSLENARALELNEERWTAALDRVVISAEREEWDAALEELRAVQEKWGARQPWLHIVTAHDELEAADALFATAESFARERDLSEFCAAIAQLTVQLRIVSDMQQLTLKNVL